MSLNWKLRLSLDDRPDDLILFLVISLLLHGAVFLGLGIYWHQLAQTLQTKPETVLPIKFMELPPDRPAVMPPSDTKQKAANNSKAGGSRVSSGAKSSSTSATNSNRPTTTPPAALTSSSSSIPSPSQPQSELPQQRPSVPAVTPLAVTTEPKTDVTPERLKPSASELLRPDTVPPVVSSTVPTPSNKPVALNNQPNSSPPTVPSTPKPSSSSNQSQRSNSVSPIASSTVPTPNSSRTALNNQPSNSSSKPKAPSAPKPSSSSNSNQSQRQNSSLLGGPVSLASRDFAGNGNDSANASSVGDGPQGVDALKDVNLGPYLDRLRQKVAQRWHPETPKSSSQTIVSFAVARTGNVDNLRVLQSSGSSKIDQAALQAVQRAAPFNPLPETYPAALLNIQFKFNISVNGQLDLSR